MTDHDTHRQLLDAAKLMLHRLEERCERSGRVWQPDWIAITKGYREIENSKEVLNQARERAR